MVQHLLDDRAAAWSSGEPAELTLVHVPGSPAYDQESGALERARQMGVNYEGLDFMVERASVIEAETDRVVLEVDVVRSAYDEVTGAEPTRHPRQMDVVDLELRHSDGGWRIWGWS